MDVTIQSQIQSPLVRTLQSVPTNSSNFIHGIPDNTPPFSKSTVKVRSTSGDPNKLDDLHVFKVPQNGHLNRAFLFYRMYGHVNSTRAISTDTDNPFSFGEGIEWIQLRTHNNIIQTLYPAALTYEVASLAKGEQMLKNNIQGLAGYYAQDENGALRDPPVLQKPTYRITPTGGVADFEQLAIKDYLIPLPFSSTMYLKDNLQTRLMEDLEIVVKTRTSPTQAPILAHDGPIAITDRNDLELTLDYINFHESVEEAIRNENFKPDVPAALLQSDHRHFTALHKSTKLAGSAGTSQIYEVDLNCDGLVTDIFVAARIHPAGRQYSRYETFHNTAFHFELQSGGESILSGFKFEFDGIESRNYSTISRQFQTEGLLPLRWSGAGAHIRLALNNTDEYFDGGISFQSLVNPKLIITATSPTATPHLFSTDLGAGDQSNLEDIVSSPTLLEFDVVLKHKVLLRIDGNTGKIAKSLES